MTNMIDHDFDLIAESSYAGEDRPNNIMFCGFS